jgi:hypothetical protein
MKQVWQLIGSLIGVLLLITLVLVLNALFQAQVTQTGSAPPPTPTSQAKVTPSPTSLSNDAWKTATLDKIQFGDPRVVLTHQGAVKIHTWLPDDRRLLLELLDPTAGEDVARGYRIVTLDVDTGQVVEYGRRDNGVAKPVWLDRTSNVAFVLRVCESIPSVTERPPYLVGVPPMNY